MTDIEIAGEPCPGRLDVTLISTVNQCWQSFVAAANPNTGVNNNDLKERCNNTWLALRALRETVLALPPQGRQLLFTSTDLTKVREQMGALNEKLRGRR